ncbi:hypothetical protein DMH27_22375 [Raoultella planticola]|uniref:Uncharacterized protein n=1 Tax=Raoultella planticola TaxID=575 RepID=A0A5P6AA47_RAOPL|nr:hypothetical protein [Raoultella planticola]QFG76838.1 hypothetical protein DMB90_15490 [Raoultella planticola]
MRGAAGEPKRYVRADAGADVLLARTGSLARLETLNDPKSALRCYRLSAQEPLLNQVIAVVCQLFKQ